MTRVSFLFSVELSYFLTSDMSLYVSICACVFMNVECMDNRTCGVCVYVCVFQTLPSAVIPQMPSIIFAETGSAPWLGTLALG